MNPVQHSPPVPVSVILVDIEGTVGSIAFVRTVLFPYARRQLPVWIEEHGQEPETRRWLDAVASELGPSASDEQVLARLLHWIDEDRKHTALKALQGLLWRDGYLRGEYQSHLYPDAAAALTTWRQKGHPLFVYSSGSVAAQQLFFAHTVAGNLLPLFDGFFDTEVGGKREVHSYQRIAQRIGERTGCAATEILFLSDVIEELDAARKAQFQTVLVDRREDYPAPRVEGHGHRHVVSFLEIVI